MVPMDIGCETEKCKYPKKLPLTSALFCVIIKTITMKERVRIVPIAERTGLWAESLFMRCLAEVHSGVAG